MNTYDQLAHNLKVCSTKDGTYVLTIGIAHLTMVGFVEFHPEIVKQFSSSINIVIFTDMLHFDCSE